MIRNIQALANDETRMRELVESSSNNSSTPALKQGLWHCSQLFNRKYTKPSDWKRLWIFTNNDNPSGER